jgi:hypothetical protein
MMLNDEIATDKDFIPEDALLVEENKERTDYRVVPFSRALDTIEIWEQINKSALQIV